jgi:hypothetical protein
MVMAAHRYCLGRQSYIIPACLEWLRDHWKQFTKNTQMVMLRDTLEFLMGPDLKGENPRAMDIDWSSFMGSHHLESGATGENEYHSITNPLTTRLHHYSSKGESINEAN